MKDLYPLGWDDAWSSRFATIDGPAGLVPMRIVSERRGAWVADDGTSNHRVELSGRLRFTLDDASERPTIGDWVAVHVPEGFDGGIVHAVLERRSSLRRKAAGNTSEVQNLAANVDEVWIIAACGGDLNPRRVERALAAVWSSGATPVVIVNKIDVADDPQSSIDAISAVAIGADLVALSALQGQGLEPLESRLSSGRTVVLIGSSGVGKSTLINALLGDQVQETRDVRVGDERGRHTTTHRDLLRLPGGGMIIDTPGTRLFGMADEADGLSTGFADIDALAETCRFRDCEHRSEPGCAVLGAIADGTLDGARLASYHKLEREAAYQARRSDLAARQREQQRWKSITKSMRSFTKERR